VRYGKAEEAQAGGGARIIETAARRLKRDGIHGPGIAALMAEAGLARRHRTAGRAAIWEIGRA
jgi:AcrR family transcriptional regulator